jgi:hypothetical protein
MSWYFIGEGRIDRLLLADTLPKVLGTGLGVVAIVGGATVDAFAAIQLVGVLAAVVASTVLTRAGSRTPREPWSIARVGRAVQERRVPLGIAISAASYLSLPTALVAVLAPQVLTVFALSERVWRAFSIFTFPVAQWLQHSTHLDAHPHRQIRSFRRWTLLIAVAYGILAALLAPFAVVLLSARTVSIDWSIAALIGVIVGAGVLPRLLGGVLLQHLDQNRALLATTALGAVIAVVCVPLGLALDGVRGAIAGVALAELLVGATQYLAIILKLRRLPRAA